MNTTAAQTAGRATWLAQGDAGGAGDRRLARALGWFSVGLGLAQVVAPGPFARLIGVPERGRSSATLRAVGVRELLAGAGILASRWPAGGLWARVAGDAVDLALLGAALRSPRAARGRVAAALAAVAKVAALDAYGAWRLTRRSQDARRRARAAHARGVTVGATMGETVASGVDVRQAVTVNRPPEEVYRFWRHLPNLPRFMAHLEAVEVLGEGRSRWTATGPAGTKAAWEAETTEIRPGELIAWRSVPGSAVDTSGVVRFAPAPGGRGTEVRVELRYAPPAGPLGKAVAGLFGQAPPQQVRSDLRRLKQVLETGQIIASEATIHGRPHPARPPERIDDSQMPPAMVSVARAAPKATAQTAREAA